MLWRGLYEDYTPLNSWRPEGHVLWQTQIPKFELEPVTASHQLTGEHPTWKVHDLSYLRHIVVHVTVLALELDLGKHKTSSQADRGKQTFAETVLLCHFSSSIFRVIEEEPGMSYAGCWNMSSLTQATRWRFRNLILKLLVRSCGGSWRSPMGHRSQGLNPSQTK